MNLTPTQARVLAAAIHLEKSLLDVNSHTVTRKLRNDVSSWQVAKYMQELRNMGLMQLIGTRTSDVDSLPHGVTTDGYRTAGVEEPIWSVVE